MPADPTRKETLHMLPADPADLAARLSPAQKRALLWLPNARPPFCWRRDDLSAPEGRTLANDFPSGLREYVPMLASWRATDLGLAVRAIIAKEAGHE